METEGFPIASETTTSTNGHGPSHADGLPDPMHVNGNGRRNGKVAHEPEAAPADSVGGLPAVLESMLFAAGEPVPVARLVDALDGPGRAEVVRALEVLGEGYERDRRGLRLVQVAGGYQLRSVAEHGRWIRRLLQERPPRLTRPMLETLAIVAYRQPCTRIEIEAVRRVDFDAVLATLTDRRLVRILGRKETPGRPLLYATTRDVLELFGRPDLYARPALPHRRPGPQVRMAPALTVNGEGVTPTSNGTQPTEEVTASSNGTQPADADATPT